MLGFKLRGNVLRLDPAMPSEWPGFTLRYRSRSDHYEVRVENPDRVGRGVAWVEIDGRRRPGPEVALEDDAGSHTVLVRLGSSQAP